MDGSNPNFRNRYSEAYGNYQGGYGPRGGYNLPPPPPPLPGYFGPPGPLMGPPMMKPPMMGPRGPGHFGPPGGFNNFGPMRPHNPTKFLLKCGVKPDSFKNVPKQVLRLYLPDHCGVCRMDLESFSFARMHYTSRNHLKNQRKWLMDSTGRVNPQEEPLKSRDLYCELCDVQITSKVHADSHYAGKNHRAVVEGRKKPKNTNLLHENAYQRLCKLIKREQKFLKTEENTNAEIAKEAIEKPLPKPNSEFYCDICKSSMSCSEQMTAHLNGKRHLTKEKQHILRMMKGNAPGDEGGDDAEEGEKVENGDNTADNTAGGDNGIEVKVTENSGEAATADQPAVTEVAADEDWVNGTGEDWDNSHTEA